jgi:hypothetical protein
MRHPTAGLFAVLALLALSSAAIASPRSELRSVDSESALRRTRRDAAWLRQASVRSATTPVVLHAKSSDLSDQLDAWFRVDRKRPAEAATPARTASNTPRP